MITSNYLASKGEEYKLGYFAAMNEKHGNADFVVRTPSGNYEVFSDFSAAIKSMKPVSRLFAPFVDGPVSSPTQTATATTKEQKTSPLGGGVETKTDEEIAREAEIKIEWAIRNHEECADIHAHVRKLILSAIREARASGQRHKDL